MGSSNVHGSTRENCVERRSRAGNLRRDDKRAVYKWSTTGHPPKAPPSGSSAGRRGNYLEGEKLQDLESCGPPKVSVVDERSPAHVATFPGPPTQPHPLAQSCPAHRRHKQPEGRWVGRRHTRYPSWRLGHFSGRRDCGAASGGRGRSRPRSPGRRSGGVWAPHNRARRGPWRARRAHRSQAA